jgi:hypothetical protein
MNVCFGKGMLRQRSASMNVRFDKGPPHPFQKCFMARVYNKRAHFKHPQDLLPEMPLQLGMCQGIILSLS